MLMPKRMKYRKWFKGRIGSRVATKGHVLTDGEYGLCADEKGKITSRQIEAARIAINRKVKRGGKLIIRIFPHKPVTKKPAETRMGKGKGAVEYYIAPVRPGTLLYEISDVTEDLAREAFNVAEHKLPIKCKFILKQEKSDREA